MDAERRAVADALRILGKKNLVLAIHDPSFPGEPDEDLGRGASTSKGAARFLTFAAGLGFTGVQLGPQGHTSAANPSPYDGTVLSRSPLNISVAPLVEQGLVAPALVQTLLAARPEGAERRVPYPFVHDAQGRILDEAFKRYRRRPEPFVARLRAFREEHAQWLVRDALYEPLCALHGRPWWREWPDDVDQRLWAPHPEELEAFEARRRQHEERFAREIERWAFLQMLAAEQHAALRETTKRLSLKLYGDLQIGLSTQDVWARRAILLRDYVMGAPPSRTNPEGQPWGYAVLDPAQYRLDDGGSGPALAFMALRMDKMLAEYDGVRIDHPHGLCDPWVYDAHDGDPLRAVQGGARLFSSPDLPDHRALARFAIARPDQIDRDVPRYHDRWVKDLDDEQVEGYAAQFEVVVQSARRNGRAIEDLLCEVLSTLPHPLERVIRRYGLGRFRVTQKASLDDPGDVYRAENAEPPDWIMLGNHDTKPVWALLPEWRGTEKWSKRRAQLAARLRVDERALEARDGALAQAMLAELFLSPAENVMVFFADLLGETDIYNRPGVVSDENWSLRVPRDWLPRYEAMRREDRALNVPRALATALRAKDAAAHRDLIARLDELSTSTPAA